MEPSGGRCRRTGIAARTGSGKPLPRLARRLRAGLVTPLPGGLGSPSVPTKGDCLNWLDAARTKGGESLPGSGRGIPPVRARKLRPRGQKSPRWSAERRPRSSQESAARRKTGAPLGAPSPRHFVGAEKGRTRRGRRRTRRRKEYGRRSVGCLKFESGNARAREKFPASSLPKGGPERSRRGSIRCGTGAPPGRFARSPPSPQAGERIVPNPQSSRYTRSRCSWRSCASTDSVAIGRASRRRIEIGSPVSSQKP